jgi:regulator of RNase E activity RraA
MKKCLAPSNSTPSAARCACQCGDLVIADQDGVVVIPAARENEVLKREVLKRAVAMHEIEEQIVAAGQL